VGIALARLGENYDHALSLLEQSFTELESLHEEFCMAYFGPYYSELFAAQAKRKLSDRFARSLDLARKVDERGLLADVLSHYATWLFTTNRLEEAMQRAEEADRLFIQLGDVAFEYEFVEGQKLSLDEVLDLALKTVEEM
jgi:hypothetical protein